jgi:tetratricopeptide (TPR) repeat protein
MRVIGDRWMHRFLYLQAKCYEKLGNFVKSIVCYNQLIKIKPKVAELFLERAIIYDKIGYPV